MKALELGVLLNYFRVYVGSRVQVLCNLGFRVP